MTNRVTTTGTGRTTRSVAVAALLAASAGIVVQILGGADYPTVPPGLLLLLAAAGLLALRNRWAPLLGVLITAFISFGAVVTPNIRNQLADPSAMGVFAGTVIQTMGLVAGLLAGLATASSRMRRTTR